MLTICLQNLQMSNDRTYHRCRTQGKSPSRTLERGRLE
nr:MAG TPA: hypothetical protein [Caudoviricetes sp.]